MNDRLENKYTMYKAVETLLDNNAVKTATIPALTTAITNFKNFIVQISDMEQARSTSTSGKAADKKQKEDALISEAVPVAAALKALGSATNNTELAVIGKATKSSLYALRDTELDKDTQIIHDTANENIADLADYGVTAATLTSLQTRIDDFIAALGVREEGSALRVAAGIEVSSLFKDNDIILKNQMDAMMEQFRESDTLFYNEYQSARTIIDL